MIVQDKKRPTSDIFKWVSTISRWNFMGDSSRFTNCWSVFMASRWFGEGTCDSGCWRDDWYDYFVCHLRWKWKQVSWERKRVGFKVSEIFKIKYLFCRIGHGQCSWRVNAKFSSGVSKPLLFQRPLHFSLAPLLTKFSLTTPPKYIYFYHTYHNYHNYYKKRDRKSPPFFGDPWNLAQPKKSNPHPWLHFGFKKELCMPNVLQ